VETQERSREWPSQRREAKSQDGWTWAGEARGEKPKPRTQVKRQRSSQRTDRGHDPDPEFEDEFGSCPRGFDYVPRRAVEAAKGLWLCNLGYSGAS